MEYTGIGDAEYVSFQLECSTENPSVNPVFVISNWKGDKPALKINGILIQDEAVYKHGIVPGADGQKLIVWINRMFENTVSFRLSAK
jgi:hypothetical protein